MEPMVAYNTKVQLDNICSSMVNKTSSIYFFGFGCSQYLAFFLDFVTTADFLKRCLKLATRVFIIQESLLNETVGFLFINLIQIKVNLANKIDSL